MTIQIVETENLKNVPPSGASVTPMSLIDTDEVHALLLNLAAGQSVAPCRMPTTVLYYVIEGHGLLRMENEQTALQTGSLVVVPAGAVRAVSAAGQMRVLAVQVQ